VLIPLQHNIEDSQSAIVAPTPPKTPARGSSTPQPAQSPKVPPPLTSRASTLPPPQSFSEEPEEPDSPPPPARPSDPYANLDDAFGSYLADEPKPMGDSRNLVIGLEDDLQF